MTGADEGISATSTTKRSGFNQMVADALDGRMEAGHMGHNYFKSLFAVGFQWMLIMVCMAIYAVLVQGIAAGGDMMGAIWTCVGYTVLLCFVLFKTGSLSKSIWGAH